MKHRIFMGAASALATAILSLNAVAGNNGNPYELIVARNAFGLRPIPTVETVKPPVTPAPPSPEIKITGITTLLDRPKAMFQYEDMEAKKAEFPPLLSKGESYKALTVVSIDPQNRRVRIRNGDAEMVLDFVHNGVKPSVGAAVAALPPAVLARLQQRLLEQQQAGQTDHSIIAPPSPVSLR